MFKRKFDFFHDRNVFVVFFHPSTSGKKKLGSMKISEIFRKLNIFFSKGFIFSHFSSFTISRSVLFFVVFRNVFSTFVLRFFHQLFSSFFQAFFGAFPAFSGLGSLERTYQKEMKRYDEKMIQIHFEFFVFFLISPVYIHSQVFCFVFSAFFSGFFFKRRVTQKYDRRDIKREVPPISIEKFGKESENNEKYFSRNFIKEMENIKQSSNRFSKIVILKDKNVRKCFKKMKINLQIKK